MFLFNIHKVVHPMTFGERWCLWFGACDFFTNPQELHQLNHTLSPQTKVAASSVISEWYGFVIWPISWLPKFHIQIQIRDELKNVHFVPCLGYSIYI